MRGFIVAIAIALGVVMPEDSTKAVLLEARYTAVEGSDPEYAQCAIERNELPHREIERMVWIIQVPAPADVSEWKRRLNDAVDPRHGSFEVTPATDEERRKVECGEVTLQQ
jgi:hypothetical protein